MTKDELPKGWVSMQVGQLGQVQLGKMLDRAKNTGTPFPYLRNVNVRWFGFDLNDLKSVPASPEERERFSVLNGDVFICEGGEPGRAAVWKDGASELLYQKALHRFRSSGAILPEWLAFRLRLDAEIGTLERHFSGSTIKHFTRETFLKYQIPIAPLAEQKRIVDKLELVLERVDACRARLARIPALLKRFRQSVLAAATSGKLTEDWRMANGANDEWDTDELGKLVIEMKNGLVAKQGKEAVGVPMSRIETIADGTINPTRIGYSTEVTFKQAEPFRFQKGDILFSHINSAAHLGKTAIYKGIPETLFHGMNLMLLRSNSEKIIPDYLEFSLRHLRGEGVFSMVAQHAVNQASINQKKLRAIQIAVPRLPEQQEIVRRVEALFSFADRIETRLAAAQKIVERLTPAVLAKAFRGELVPQDPADEPASALLARLREARAAAPAKPKRGRRTPAG